MKKIISIICVVVLLLACSGVAASAVSFTHKDEPNGSTTNALSRELYTPVKTITATDLDIKVKEQIRDMHCTPDGEIYVLLSEASTVVVLNKDYTLKEEISIVDADGLSAAVGAQGIFVDTNGDIYICDTEYVAENGSDTGRILVLDAEGNYKEEWGVPDSPLIPDDFIYRPTRFTKDDDGYVYIISEGCFYGALAYSPKNEFMGFFGANRVSATALNTISYLFDMLTSNDTKKAASTKVLPYSFVDMTVDINGYLTVCSGKTQQYSNSKGQIRKISPGGSNILLKRDLSGTAKAADSVNFLETKWTVRPGKVRVQDMVAIDVDSQDFIFALDSVYGLVYVYDNTCNLLGTFGGGLQNGTETGEFIDPRSMVVQGTNVLVADYKSGTITVFERTEFGKLFCDAQTLTLKGDYLEAKPLWKQVLAQDAGCQLAYRGLANAAYSEKDYDAALEYAKLGLDYTIYDLAWQVKIKSFIADYFIFFFIGAIALIVGIGVLLVKMKKRKTALIQNQQVKTLFETISHPFRAYEDIKYKGYGSVWIALILVVLFFLSSALEATSTGFLYCMNSARTYNILFTLGKTVGLVLLWVIVNWLMCTLFSGKGSFKEVLIVTAYALLPLIAFSFVYVGLSHILPYSGAALLGGIRTILMIYTFYLLSIGMMAIHEYTFPKFLITGVVTVVCMILAVFIGFIMVVLLQQFWNFLYSIFMEAVFRN